MGTNANQFKVNSTKVNITQELEEVRITSDIVLADRISAENGSVVGSNGVHVASFYTQNPGFVLIFHQELTPAARILLHTSVEEFIEGAFASIIKTEEQEAETIATEEKA